MIIIIIITVNNMYELTYVGVFCIIMLVL